MPPENASADFLRKHAEIRFYLLSLRRKFEKFKLRLPDTDPVRSGAVLKEYNDN